MLTSGLLDVLREGRNHLQLTSVVYPWHLLLTDRLPLKWRFHLVSTAVRSQQLLYTYTIRG